MSRVPAVIVVSVISSALMAALASVTLAGQSTSRVSDAPSEPTDETADQRADTPGSEPVPATSSSVNGSFDLRPHVLNMKSCGKYVTGMLALPDGFTVRDVFIPSVRLNGVVYASTSFGPHNPVVEYQNKDTLMLKFEKDSVLEILSPGSEVPVWVSGQFTDGTGFVAFGDSLVVA